MLTQLKNIGLGDKEARVYLAMLELGPASVLEIAAKAGVNRPTAYVQIEALKKRGLVSTQTKGKKQLFAPESPEQLEAILREEKLKIQEKQGDLEKILGDLKTLYNLAEEKPQVRFFEGKEGLLRMQEEFLKCREKLIRGIFNMDAVYALFPEHRGEYTERRVKKRIRGKSIYTSSRGEIMKRNDETFLRESRYIPISKLPFSADITIFDNKVAIAALKGKVVGAVIEHKEIADSFKGLFELAWVLADKL